METSIAIMGQIREAELRQNTAEADRLYDLYWKAVDRERAEAHRLTEATYQRLGREARQAQLIAAAPDLLAACQAALDFFAHGTPIHVGSVAHHRIAAAVAKARGEQYDDPTA